ncbi:hypothetical protein FGO68_gene2969 [Halteria grandinella]|uniref:Uncharacterized protein n=1 Tax=Halteria grandinella TaxID=5974 RepID=A0A8J8NV76_HALGN|nr:hypothetical protein FGO68_gene2969 [Halteria grandinella]
MFEIGDILKVFVELLGGEQGKSYLLNIQILNFHVKFMSLLKVIYLETLGFNRSIFIIRTFNQFQRRRHKLLVGRSPLYLSALLGPFIDWVLFLLNVFSWPYGISLSSRYLTIAFTLRNGLLGLFQLDFRE